MSISNTLCQPEIYLLTFIFKVPAKGRSARSAEGVWNSFGRKKGRPGEGGSVGTQRSWGAGTLPTLSLAWEAAVQNNGYLHRRLRLSLQPGRLDRTGVAKVLPLGAFS